MKCSYINLNLIILITVTITINISINSARLKLKAPSTPAKGAEDEISDKELDALLKDPKYAALAGDILKPGESVSSLITPTKKGTTASASVTTPPSTSQTSSSNSHYMSSSYKDHLDRMKQGNSNTNSKFSKDRKHDSLDDDILGKLTSDPLKDLEILGEAKKAEPEHENHNEKSNKDKKTEVDEKFKSFDFISKQQARFLIEVLKQPVFFNMLPAEAQTIVKATIDNFSFKFVENEKLNDFIETSLMNSPNSQTFVDPDGMIGRKGILTLIDPENGDSKFVWTISNAKVLTFFQSQSLLTIVKLYRNSSIIIKDINATPCFLISSIKDTKDGSVLVCSTSTQEKEVWVQTIKSHLNK